MTITVESAGLDRLIVRLEEAPKKIDEAIRVAMIEQTHLLREEAAARMAALFQNPGRMQNSLKEEVARTTPETITGTVTASGLPYLRIQEYGGRTRPHDIVPVNAKALAFFSPSGGQFGGKHTTQDMVFAMVVHHPGSKMPERSYMRSALALRRKAIAEAFQRAAATQVAEAL